MIEVFRSARSATSIFETWVVVRLAICDAVRVGIWSVVRAAIPAVVIAPICSADSFATCEVVSAAT